MYHQVGEDPEPGSYSLFVTAENFREQMNYLKNNGYTLINFDELSDIENITKPIIVTFDDGYENNMIAYEILNELRDESFQPKATFYIIGSKIDTDKFLSREQIKEISDSGIVSIQSHIMTHPFFNDKEKMDRLNYTFELSESKSILEEITGKEVNTIAYPYGSYNDRVIEETKKYYDYAVTTRLAIASSNDLPYELPRVRVRYDTTQQ